MYSPCLRGTSLPKISVRLAVAVMALMLALPAAAQMPNPAAAKVAEYSTDPNATKISLDLLEIADGVKKGKFSLKEAPKMDLFQSTPKGGGLLVDVICTRLDADVLKKFALPNSRVRDAFFGSKWVVLEVYDLDDLAAVAAIPEVGMIKPQEKPYRYFQGIADGRADRAMATTPTAATNGWGGQGVKVGVLSDSFARTDDVRSSSTTPAPGFAGTLKNAVNQLTGDLPETVTLLRDDWPGQDEGAAMAELIHDIAPGAELMFHTAQGGQAVFADGINRLVSSGAQVIVDDIIYFDEPFYQDGLVARAAANAVRSGAAFFSAAGNFGDNGLRQTYRDVNPSASEKANPPTGKDLHNWDGGNPYLPVYLTPGSWVRVLLQWNQPFWSVNPTSTPRSTSGSQIDFDMYLVSQPIAAALASPLQKSREPQGMVGTPLGDAREGFAYTANTTQTVFLCVDHYQGAVRTIPQSSSVPVEFRLIFITSGTVAIQGVTPSTPGATMFGHALASGVVSVAAIPWWEAPPFAPYLGPTPVTDPEAFSSRGGWIPIPFDTFGKLKASSSRMVFGPTVAGVDGNNTTFFGSSDSVVPIYEGEPDGFPNFFGTSAAAPNVAAIAALLKSKTPALTPAQIKSRLEGKVWDIFGYRAASGRDSVTGYGLVNGAAVLTGP